jgi:hypothetical protein
MTRATARITSIRNNAELTHDAPAPGS